MTAQLSESEFERGAASVQYKAVSGAAITGLVLALASVLAFNHPLLLILPAVGAVVSWAAARRIERDPLALSGRFFALAGLALSVMIGVGAITRFISRQTSIEREARAASEEWFAYTAAGEPHKAHQLSLRPVERAILDDKLWRAYRHSASLQKQLRDYIRQQPMRTVLALGKGATARYYETEAHQSDYATDRVVAVYAVTYEEEGKKKSFFVRLSVTRTKDAASGITGWQVGELRGGYRPESWPKPTATRQL